MGSRAHSPLVLLAVAAALLTTRGDALSATTAVPTNFSDELVASVASPTALAFTPDGRMLITTQPGQLRVYEDGALVSTPALNLAGSNFCSTSERGLLGVAVDPNFSANGYIYLYYSPRIGGECRNRLSRFTMTGNTAASELILINSIPAEFGTHNAGDVHVGKDGNLYVSVGDGGGDYAGDSGSGAANDAARDMHALVGKILRLTRDGGIPADNPFQGAGTARCNTTGVTTAPNKCREIYATGLRNPFRIAFDPNAAGVKFHINDVGQNTWEEIDLGAPAADYGWNVREGPCVTGSTSNCGAPPAGMTNPIYSYRQGDPSGCRAITGGAFVPNGIWPAAYTGSYMFADYVCGRIFKLDQQGGSYVRTDFATGLGSNSAVHLAFGPYQSTQALYYTTYEAGGSVRRITYTGTANRVPTADLSASPTSGAAPLTVDFDGSGSSDPDAGDTLTYLWDFGDGQTSTGSSPTTSHTYTNPGTFTASLRVSDNLGATSAADAVQIQPGNTAPSPVIETPASGARFRVGETVVLDGSATDPQDGALANSRLSWRVLRHHGTSHTHPWLQETTGNDIPISTPGPEDLATTTTSFLEVRLTATDSQGLATTVTRSFQPRLVDLTFATQPAGLKLELNGEEVTAPFTFSSWEAWQFPISARRQQDGAGATWVFDHWSDSGAASHTIATGATPTTYTATFRPNAAPNAAASSVSTSEDTAKAVTLSATDPDGDPVTFAIEQTPANGTLGSLVGNAVTYTPAANANGPDSFGFSATDGAATSPDTNVSITVTEVNDAPDAVNDMTAVAEDGSVLVDVRANDSKGPANESTQTLTVSSVTDPPHGTAAIEGGGVRYTPDATYSGTDSFGYQVCDNGTTAGSSAALCDSATVLVTVGAAAPVATGVAAAAIEDVEVAIELAATDPNGDALTFQIVGAPGHGTIVGLAGSAARYLPSPNYNGPDSFTFRATDGGLQSNVALVSIAVQAVNDPPSAAPDFVRAASDAPVVIDVLANDSPGPRDEAGEKLAVGAVGLPDRGTASAAAGGGVLYTPSSTDNAPATFTYTVCDDGRSGGLPDPRCATAAVDFAFSTFAVPRNVSAPRIVGGARAGTLAAAGTGEWDSPLIGVEYRWLRCPPPGRSGCAAIRGAAGSRYRVSLADLGKVLRVLVTARNRFGSSAATSAPGRPVDSPVEIEAVRHRGNDWVLLRNHTRRSVPLAGWTLGDGNSVHTIGRAAIGALRTLRVDTRDFWGARDRAALRTPGGRIADSCAPLARC